MKPTPERPTDRRLDPIVAVLRAATAGDRVAFDAARRTVERQHTARQLLSLAEWAHQAGLDSFGHAAGGAGFAAVSE